MPDPDAADALAKLASLRSRHPNVRWASREKLHLTLVFLGQTDADRVVDIGAAVTKVAATHAPFTVATGQADGLTDERRGGVAWLRLGEGSDPVLQLALDLDQAIGSRTYGGRHRPRPHLTVARRVDQAMLDDLGDFARRTTFSWQVERLVLFRSHMGPGGSRYEELASAMLGR